MNRVPQEKEGRRRRHGLGADYKAGLSSFGGERKEERIDAHVRSLLVWRQEDKLMPACLKNFIKQKARISASGSRYLE